MKTVSCFIGQNFGLVGKTVRRCLATTALTATGIVALSGSAFADNWTDHVATEGSISVDTSIPDTTNITQHTDFVKVQGDGDINAGWTVNLAQPSSGSTYVLYDIENDPTEIMGALNANGRVYIFDQNGVIFGKNSQVNVGSIVASTTEMEDARIDSQGTAQFKPFTGNEGKIVNNGTINVGTLGADGTTARSGGFAAFVAPGVENNGVINAKMGTVAMASGEKVTLDLYGDNLVNVAVEGSLKNALIENKGAIKAEGGNVVITASAAKNAVENVINMEGVIDVSSVSVKGGKIVLGGGNTGVVKVAGTLKADGKDGGTVKVTGKNIDVASTAKISANAVTAGKGGKVDVIATDTLNFAGKIEAKGGALQGDGGAVDTSGHGLITVSGDVDASAVNGKAGNWTIDPSDLTVTDGPSVYPSSVNAGSIETALNSGTNVYLNTNGTPDQPGQNGTITVDANITKSSGSAATLFLNAAGDIIVNAGKTISATGAAILNVVFDALESITVDGSIFTNGGDITFTANGDPAADFITGPQTNINVFGIVDAQGGDIDFSQTGEFYGAVDSIRTTGTGTIKLEQNQFDTESDLIGLGATIQNAIDAVKNTGTGYSAVYVGAGTYDESVKVYEDNFLIGGNNYNVPANSTRNDESVIRTLGTGFRVTGNNVLIDGFKIIGGVPDIDLPGEDGSVSSFGILGGNYGVWADNGDNVVISNNIIEGTLLNGIYAERNNGVIVDSNKVTNTGDDAIKLEGSTGTILVTDNVVGDETNATKIIGNGIGFYGVYGGLIQGNQIFNTQTVLPDHASGIYLTGSRFTQVGGGNAGDGNTIRGANWDGIKINGSHDIWTEGNNIQGSTRVGIWSISSDRGYIVGNTTRDSNITAGIGVLGGNDILIDGNFVYDTQGNGIEVKSATGNVNIVNNTVGEGGSEIVGNGIGLYGIFGGLIQGNTVTNTKTVNPDFASGVYVTQSRNTVVNGNTIRDAEWDGIKINGSHNVTTSNNNITNSTRVGIWSISSDDAKIFGNTTRDSNITAGIGVLGGNNINVADNFVYDTQGNGIEVKSATGQVFITGNTVGETGSEIVGNGIGLYGVYGGLIQGNTITNTKTVDPDFASGIYVTQSRFTVVDDNTISDANWDGIKINGSHNVTTSNNTITNSTRVGIWSISSNDANIFGNSTRGSGVTAGIGILGGTNITIDDNEVYDTLGNGIEVRDAKGFITVTDNVVGEGAAGEGSLGSFITGNGIAFYGIYGGTIQRNRITNTLTDEQDKASGIYVFAGMNTLIGGGETDAGDNFINGNTITGADWDGIKVAGGSQHRILGNDIDNSTRVGIWGISSGDIEIGFNTVNDSNVTAGIASNYSTNAFIHDNIVTDSVGDGILANDVDGTVRITGNTIDTSTDDGIEVVDSAAYVYIVGNRINNSGFGAEAGDDIYGGDGIHVRNVTASSTGGDIRPDDIGNGLYNIVVANNPNISNSADDGIEIVGTGGFQSGNQTFRLAKFVPSTGPVFVSSNIVINSGFDTTGLDGFGGDGIHVRNVGYVAAPSEPDGDEELPGDVLTSAIFALADEQPQSPYSVTISGNSVDNSADDGIEVYNDLDSTGTAPVLVENNLSVTDSGDHGLFISGPSHQNVIVQGNGFATFDIGAEFQSGLINLTGTGNSFDNGRIGLRFNPEFSDSLPPPQNAFFAKILNNALSFLDLVDNDGEPDTLFASGETPTNFGGTIGNQTFTNIDDYYVQLEANAFSHNGDGAAYPVWINGLNSSYDGFVPADNVDGNGFLSQADFDDMNARMFDFRDADSRDIFFFGLRAPDDLDTALIDQGDIFNRFAAFNGDITGLNVRILGLPTIPGGGTAAQLNNISTFAGGPATTTTGNPADLNNIETAAGGSQDATTPVTPETLNTISTEAGGDNQRCWGNAIAAASAGQAVNVVYGGSFADNLAQAEACGGTI